MNNGNLKREITIFSLSSAVEEINQMVFELEMTRIAEIKKHDSTTLFHRGSHLI